MSQRAISTRSYFPIEHDGDQLAFEKGEVFTLIEHPYKGGWSKVVAEKRVGFVPSQYIQPVAKADEAEIATKLGEIDKVFQKKVASASIVPSSRLLSKSDVMAVLNMKDAISIMRAAFTDLAQGNAVMPQRTPVVVSEHSGVGLFMPAFLKGMGALGSKTVTVFKNNPTHHTLPTIMGTILLLNPETGAPLSVMDGGYLTAMRTGAVAGLATEELARTDARVHTVFGSGGMARAQVWAVQEARPEISKIIVVSNDLEPARLAFLESLKDIAPGVELLTMDDREAAVRQADILTLITSASTPIIEGAWVQEGTHINGVGAHAPAMRELDPATIQKSKVVCDLVDACKAEAGDLKIPADEGEWSWDKVHGSLGDVLIHKIPGREREQDITLFKSVGLAIQDISTAHHVFTQASEQGIGTLFDFNATS